MIVDFHAHAFPDALAERSVAFLAAKAGISHYADGTVKGLAEAASRVKADGALVLPVVTKPSQFRSINAFAARINAGEFDAYGVKLRSFGGIHPDDEDIEGELAEIKAMGLKGVKIHPDYQQTFIDDAKNLRIIEGAAKLGLLVSVHAGLDLGFPDCTHCTPARAKNMLRLTGAENVILAHMGGFSMWEEVADLLVGEKVRFDTGVVARYMDPALASKIIKAHGADKVLFATDSPWASYEDSVAFVRSLDLSEEEKTKIFGENAAKLLGLKYDLQ